MRITRTALLALSGALAMPWAAAAQETSEAPLAGPRVRAREVPGVLEQYAPGDIGRFAGAGRAVPLPVFFEAVRSLAGQGLGLSAEQSERVRGELGLFREELAAFVGAHGAELRDLVAALPGAERGRAGGALRDLQRLGQMLDRIDREGLPVRADRAGGRRRAGEGVPVREPGEEGFRLDFRARPGVGEEDAAPAAPMTGVDPGADAGAMREMAEMTEMAEGQEGAARERLRELREMAPSAGALQTRLWAVLSEAQRAVVGGAMESYLAEQRAGAEAERLARDIERRRAESAARAEDGARPALGARARERLLAQLDSGVVPEGLWEMLPERARERLGALPEERRAGAIARYLRARD